APDDVGLVRAVATGSQDALAALYDRHAGAVYGVASRLTTDRQLAEEVVQETFLAVWNRAELFDPKAGSLAAWLHTIARNRTVDRLRAIGRRPRPMPGPADSTGSWPATRPRPRPWRAIWRVVRAVSRSWAVSAGPPRSSARSSPAGRRPSYASGRWPSFASWACRAGWRLSGRGTESSEL